MLEHENKFQFFEKMTITQLELGKKSMEQQIDDVFKMSQSGHVPFWLKTSKRFVSV